VLEARGLLSGSFRDFGMAMSETSRQYASEEIKILSTVRICYRGTFAFFDDQGFLVIRECRRKDILLRLLTNLL
jgi:hypothetical protein